ncbi:sulfotransferase [uncultured Aliiroseovarius sp.]|uniref:sulfotransferase family protein n=1 Tax=uncultured Aliiroseovarius sp. TaxID=1658783 RepID=UPI0026105B64|nr:sulfotransferase [uncultured Aliiroseovarius sp.]
MQPIKVIGFPRSGTSLLQRLLTSHPKIHCPPETYVFSGAARMIRESSGEGPDLGMLTGLAFAGFEEADVLARLRALCFSFLDEAAEKEGKPLWAEKSAFDIFDLDGIETLLSGHCRFICLVRNPLDVIASMKELTDQMGQNVPEMRPWMAQYDNYYLAWAAAWNDLNRAMLDMHNRLGDSSLLCRYEDLTADPEAELRRITDFAELPPFAGKIAPEKAQIGLGDWKIFNTDGVEKTRVARWRRSLPRSSAKAALEVVGPLMEELDYDLPRISAPVTRQQRIVQYKRAKQMALSAHDHVKSPDKGKDKDLP